MKTIRNNLFETNSSSIHTLAISKDNDNVNIKFIESNCNEKYGWDKEYYHDANNKFNYLITALRIYSDYKKEDSLYNKLLNILGEYHVHFKIEFNDTGSIDQPYDLIHNIIPELIKNPNKLMRFLFNNESYLRTGCDSDCYIDDLNYSVEDPKHIINENKFEYLHKGN